jgi:hypothetical protein
LIFFEGSFINVVLRTSGSAGKYPVAFRTEAVNWNSWPTTFFFGRDGHVHFVHAGFPSNGSGELYRQAKEGFTAQVESLLAK